MMRYCRIQCEKEREREREKEEIKEIEIVSERKCFNRGNFPLVTAC